jgi:hypothetical protein
VLQQLLVIVGLVVMGNAEKIASGENTDYILMSCGTIGYTLIDIGTPLLLLGIGNIEIIYDSMSLNQI